MALSGMIGWLLGWVSRYRLDYSSSKSSGTRVSLGPSYVADFDLVDEFNDLSRKVDRLEARFNELEDWLVEK
jgi:hypothetical protein